MGRAWAGGIPWLPKTAPGLTTGDNAGRLAQLSRGGGFGLSRWLRRGLDHPAGGSTRWHDGQAVEQGHKRLTMARHAPVAKLMRDHVVEAALGFLGEGGVAGFLEAEAGECGHPLRVLLIGDGLFLRKRMLSSNT